MVFRRLESSIVQDSWPVAVAQSGRPTSLTADESPEMMQGAAAIQLLVAAHCLNERKMLKSVVFTLKRQ